MNKMARQCNTNNTGRTILIIYNLNTNKKLDEHIEKTVDIDENFIE